MQHAFCDMRSWVLGFRPGCRSTDPCHCPAISYDNCQLLRSIKESKCLVHRFAHQSLDCNSELKTLIGAGLAILAQAIPCSAGVFFLNCGTLANFGIIEQRQKTRCNKSIFWLPCREEGNMLYEEYIGIMSPHSLLTVSELSSLKHMRTTLPSTSEPLLHKSSP